jgi:hypothetical protein
MDGEPYWMGDTQDGKEKKMDSIETIQKKHREGVEYVETALAVEAIEKAREEERGRILDILDRRYSVEEDDIDELGACITIIKSLGPVSSIEDRVRRDVAKDLMPDLLIAEHGLISADASLRGPETRWPPVENGLNSIERVIKKLDAIAEGREG